MYEFRWELKNFCSEEPEQEQDYETTLMELQGVKMEHEEAKKQLSALRKANVLVLRKIQLIGKQLQPTKAQIKAKGRVYLQLSSPQSMAPLPTLVCRRTILNRS